MSEVRYVPDVSTIKIVIDDLPHLILQRSELVGIQSWIAVGDKMWCIEFYTTHNTILCEYESQELWEKILKLLNKHL